MNNIGPKFEEKYFYCMQKLFVIIVSNYHDVPKNVNFKKICVVTINKRHFSSAISLGLKLLNEERMIFIFNVIWKRKFRKFHQRRFFFYLYKCFWENASKMKTKFNVDTPQQFIKGNSQIYSKLFLLFKSVSNFQK